MAKKVKFALEMADGEQVRNIDALKEHFDIDKIVGYYHDGRLLTWLKDRRYDEEADKVAELSKSDPQLHNKLCVIFGIESTIEELDAEEIGRRTEHLNKLKQYTDDKEILSKVDQVAFNQEDLGDLLDKDVNEIYLCNNRFNIPLDIKNKTYIGIEKVIAVIRSDKIVNFDELNVHFKNVCFDDNYDSILLYNEAQSAYEAKDYKTALEKYKRSANLGYKKAMYKVASMYHKGEGTSKALNEAVNWYTKAVELGDTKSMVELVHIYRDDNGETIQQDFQKVAEYFKQAAEAGDGDGMYSLGMLYDFGQGVTEDEKLAFEWFLKAAEAGNVLGMVNAGKCYMLGKGIDKNLKEAGEWLKQAAETGSYEGMMGYGKYLRDYLRNYLLGPFSRESEELKEALDWFKRAYDKSSGIDASKAAYEISTTYREIGFMKFRESDFYGSRNYDFLGALATIVKSALCKKEREEANEEADKWLEKAKQLGYHC